MVDIENKTEDELKELGKHYSTLAAKAEDSQDKHASQSIEELLDSQKKEKDEK